MKRPSIIFLAGPAVALAVFVLVYTLRTAPHHAAHDVAIPELAWIKSEFDVDEARLAKISELHRDYKPQCLAMCRRIDRSNEELGELLAHSDRVTAEIEAKLTEAAQLRIECQKVMLQHFYQVSQVMPPEEGRRYLAKVQEATISHKDWSMHPKPAHQ